MEAKPFALRRVDDGVSTLKLFSEVGGGDGGCTRLADQEEDVAGLGEVHMGAMLGVRLLSSEYSTGPVHDGRIDSLGLDENGAQVIVEFERGADGG
ncbi:hypothetical protein GCM10010215_26040 [Streptomyces virginiae]|uniref:DUF397 domain-containing protein n=1 Tax=Streptomyces virginiae TaxID=1961 RepID=A0ABQ3NN64_STRVG|nr:hypothetical protein GCM10010215_26040 [Streptomyces virginiae]GHI14217.1 hypothetical protein Scinn_36800 [Streptomyces virginiae]